MDGTAIIFRELIRGPGGEQITIERVSLLPEEPRGVAELRRLSEACEPALQCYTST